MKKPFAFLAACSVALSASISAQASGITQFIDDLNADDYALRQSARLDLRAALVSASPQELKSLERELLRAIGPDQDWATRDWSIRMLELVGTSAAVKPLTRLLNDADPRIQDLARRALSAIPDRRAAAALERALPSQPAVFADALAYRHDDGAVRELAAELKSGSAAAALALGKIGGSAARSALSAAYAGAKSDGPFKRDLELALLDAGVDDAALVLGLVNDGQNEAIKTAAFARLVEIDEAGAAAALASLLAIETDASLRGAFLRIAMGSPLQDTVVGRLATLPEADQIVVLDKIADAGLSAYEPAVLALLAGASPTLQPAVVRTLGHIGSDASFDPLLALYLANERDRDVTAALARLQAESTDRTLITTVEGDGEVAARVAALRLLVLRNTDGVSDLVNRLSGSDHPAELREAAFKGMEIVGGPESVRLLLELVLNGDDLKRDAQGSLKKLSANLAVPDFLWTEYYAPALAAAASDDSRRDVLVIVDGNAGAASAEYLQQLVIDGSPLAPDALNALRRWTDISGVDAWVAIGTAANATEETVAMAKQGIIRLLSSTRTTGFFPIKVEKAAAALQAFVDDPDFVKGVVKTYDRPMHWQTRMTISRLFPEFLADERVQPEVQELLDRAAFN